LVPSNAVTANVLPVAVVKDVAVKFPPVTTAWPSIVRLSRPSAAEIVNVPVWVRLVAFRL